MLTVAVVAVCGRRRHHGGLTRTQVTVTEVDGDVVDEDVDGIVVACQRSRELDVMICAVRVGGDIDHNLVIGHRVTRGRRGGLVKTP